MSISQASTLQVSVHPLEYNTVVFSVQCSIVGAFDNWASKTGPWDNWASKQKTFLCLLLMITALFKVGGSFCKEV